MNIATKRAQSVTDAFNKPKTKDDKSKQEEQNRIYEEAIIERVSQRIFRAIDDKLEHSMRDLRIQMESTGEKMLRESEDQVYKAIETEGDRYIGRMTNKLEEHSITVQAKCLDISTG